MIQSVYSATNQLTIQRLVHKTILYRKIHRKRAFAEINLRQGLRQRWHTGTAKSKSFERKRDAPDVPPQREIDKSMTFHSSVWEDRFIEPFVWTARITHSNVRKFPGDRRIDYGFMWKIICWCFSLCCENP